MKKHELEGLNACGDTSMDEEVKEVEGGAFQCDECNKTFDKEHHLSVHRREHTGERPHTCILCGQSFMLRNQLLEHIGEHKRNGLMMYMGNQRSGNIPGDLLPPALLHDIKPLSTPFADSDSGSETESDNDDLGSGSKVQANNGNQKTLSSTLPNDHAISFQKSDYSSLNSVDYNGKDYASDKDNQSNRKDLYNGEISNSHYLNKGLDIENQNNYNRHFPHTNHKSNCDKSMTNSSIATFLEREYLLNSVSASESGKSLINNLGNSHLEQQNVSQSDITGKSHSFKKPHSSVHESENQTLPYDILRANYQTSLAQSNHPVLSSSTSNSETNLPEAQNRRPSDLTSKNHAFKKLHSSAHLSESQSLPYDILRASYQTSLSQSNHALLSSSMSNAHSSLPDEQNRSDIDNDQSASMELNNQIIKQEPPRWIPQDYRSYTNYNFPYDIPNSSNHHHHRSSFAPNFASRFSTDSQLTANFQLLPQTAFPEKSHPS